MTARISERQMKLRNRLQEHPAFNALGYARKSPYRFLTLFGDTGSFSRSIAREAAIRLGWHLNHEKTVNSIAENGRVRDNIARQLDERLQGHGPKADLRFLPVPGRARLGSEKRYGALVRPSLRLRSEMRTSWAEAGILLCAGWGMGPTSGSPDGRRCEYAGRERSGRRLRKQARQRPLAAGAHLRQFIRHHYGKRVDDLSSCDLKLKTDHLSVEQWANAIMAVMIPGIPPMETRRS